MNYIPSSVFMESPSAQFVTIRRFFRPKLAVSGIETGTDGHLEHLEIDFPTAPSGSRMQSVCIRKSGSGIASPRWRERDSIPALGSTAGKDQTKARVDEPQMNTDEHRSEMNHGRRFLVVEPLQVCSSVFICGLHL
jgi:hypothetical protein